MEKEKEEGEEEGEERGKEEKRMEGRREGGKGGEKIAAGEGEKKGGSFDCFLLLQCQRGQDMMSHCSDNMLR